MESKRILIADNITEYLDTCAEFFEARGYQTKKASTVADARRILEDDWLHLAILDIRLTEDDNPTDISGIILARDVAQAVPKIILTKFQTWDAVRDALGTTLGNFPPAVDFVAKQEGLEVLLRHVEQAYSRHVRINPNLVIRWNETRPLSFAHLAGLMEPGLRSERLSDRADELDDMFRRLFYEKNHIRIDRLLWHRNGRVALVVFAFKEGVKPESFVVVCGQNAIVNEEAQRYEQFAPKAPGETGTMLSMKAETTHFAANAYTVVGNDLEKAQTLGGNYRFAQEKVFKDTLTTLFQNTLQEWHQDKPIPKKSISLETLYRQRLELSEEYFSRASFDERIKAIESQIATLGLRIMHTDDLLTFNFSNQSFSFPDPLSIFSPTPDQNEMLLVINVPGRLTGENILTDESGHAWLTDFAHAGLAPLFWNYVALEAAIRFDWVDTTDLLRRYELENCLINTDFAKPETRDLEPIIGKPARVITTIRKLSARAFGRENRNYHHGIFFHAARRLADFDPTLPLTYSELARLGHILLSMAMIAGKLEQSKADEQSDAPMVAAEIRIVDEKARIVVIGNRKEHLAPQPFEILRHLYNHANEVCTKEEFLKDVLKGEYEESYLPTLIGRIRKVIEDDPEHPRYLITEPNAGYRLILKPE
jgi:DNA-binding response OmpR family regulator